MDKTPEMGEYEAEFATWGEILVPLAASGVYLSFRAMDYLLSLPLLPGRAVWDAVVIGGIYNVGSIVGYVSGREIGHLLDLADSTEIDFKKLFTTQRRGETHGRESTLRAYPRQN